MYRQPMTSPELIPAAEATTLLGYSNRSSLTRLVQAGKIAPAFKASGKSGEEFFNRTDIEALISTPTARLSDVPSPKAPVDGHFSVGGAA